LLDAQRFLHDRIHSARQLTDAYLLGQAVQHEGRLVTFGQRTALSAVAGAQTEIFV